MRKTLLHAVVAVLTVLMLVVRHRCALAGTYSGKRRNVRQQGSQHDSSDKPRARRGSAPCATYVELSNPKYKRDPVIEVDSEEIGYQPLL